MTRCEAVGLGHSSANEKRIMSDYDPRDGRRTTAFILLGIAAYIVLANTGILDFLGISTLIGWVFRTIFSLIPVAILTLGIYWLSRSETGEKPIIAWFVTLFGAVLLTSQIGLFGLSFGEMFTPMVLVIVAFVIINPRNLIPRRMNMLTEDLGEDSEQIQLVAFMGGGELDYTTRELKGGEVIAVWGGYKIDFTEADMEDDSMELNLFCIMGGVEIIVPSNWEVEKRGAVCIMGGFSNKTKCLAEELELPRKTLIVKGFALMGGGEIRN
jgi:predicted membrane protein